MPYLDIPGIRPAYLDGSFRIPFQSTQPVVIVIGTAESGMTNTLYNVTNASQASAEFGATSPLLKATHELLAQGANRILLMRSGGTKGSLVITDSLTATLTVVPEYRDDEIMDRYSLIIENDGTSNRYLVYDFTDQTFIYDSSEIETVDNSLVTVTDTGIDLFTLGDREDPANSIPMADLVSGDLTVDGSATVSSVVATQGTDGTSPSLVERYAALANSYHQLDFRDANWVLPTDVYIDDANIADDSSAATYGYFWAGVPVPSSTKDKLGYVWQYLYQGTMYVYFTDTPTYFSVSKVAATKTIVTDLVLTSLVLGKGGNANTLQVALGGALATTVTENSNGGLDILLTAVTGVTTTSAAAADINTALDAFTHSTGAIGSDLVSAAGAATVISATVAKSNFTSGAGGHALTHAQLTGDSIPSAVSTKFSAGADAELRECNFAHQLASFCYLASTTWSDMLGCISFKIPTAFSRSSLSSWVGDLPDYTDTGIYKYIDAPADNGSGLLGNKFLAGFSKTSDGYRSHLVTDGNSTDGYAYGGFILTAGASLPTGTTRPYGIDDSDEKLDSGGKPIDIGKHIFPTYEWPVFSNGYNGGSTYRGSFPATFVGKVCVLPVNQEPIGDNGVVKKVQNIMNVHFSQIQDLASIRAIGLMKDDTTGFQIVSAKTAAHPDSDYTRLSTIRCVNDHLAAVRKIARPYIGKPLTTSVVESLQASLDQLCLAKREAGYNQGAKTSISFSRTDKILGRLTVKLRMVPPFSIQAITVETSLAADETEL